MNKERIEDLGKLANKLESILLSPIMQDLERKRENELMMLKFSLTECYRIANGED